MGTLSSIRQTDEEGIIQVVKEYVNNNFSSIIHGDACWIVKQLHRNHYDWNIELKIKQKLINLPSSYVCSYRSIQNQQFMVDEFKI